jgi:hypothetical protein
MKFALWLMNLFNIPQQNPSLIGDITEEWRAGRSTGWLARQTFMAIGAALRTGLLGHVLRTLGAVAFGWVIGTAVPWGMSFHRVYGPIDAWYKIAAIYAPVIFLNYLWPGMVSWMVGRLHRIQPLGAALLFIATFSFVRIVTVRVIVHDYPGASPLPLLLGAIPALCSMLVGALLAARNSARVKGMA